MDTQRTDTQRFLRILTEIESIVSKAKQLTCEEEKQASMPEVLALLQEASQDFNAFQKAAKLPFALLLALLQTNLRRSTKAELQDKRYQLVEVLFGGEATECEKPPTQGEENLRIVPLTLEDVKNAGGVEGTFESKPEQAVTATASLPQMPERSPAEMLRITEASKLKKDPGSWGKFILPQTELFAHGVIKSEDLSNLVNKDLSPVNKSDEYLDYVLSNSACLVTTEYNNTDEVERLLGSQDLRNLLHVPLYREEFGTAMRKAYGAAQLFGYSSYKIRAALLGILKFEDMHDDLRVLRFASLFLTALYALDEGDFLYGVARAQIISFTTERLVSFTAERPPVVAPITVAVAEMIKYLCHGEVSPSRLSAAINSAKAFMLTSVRNVFADASVPIFSTLRAVCSVPEQDKAIMHVPACRYCFDFPYANYPYNYSEVSEVELNKVRRVYARFDYNGLGEGGSYLNSKLAQIHDLAATLSVPEKQVTQACVKICQHLRTSDAQMAITFLAGMLLVTVNKTQEVRLLRSALVTLLETRHISVLFAAFTVIQLLKLKEVDPSSPIGSSALKKDYLFGDANSLSSFATIFAYSKFPVMLCDNG